jgi:hypothetical protein
MITTLFYPTYLLIAFSLSLIYIPKKDYKEYLIYGFLLGGLGDMLVVGLFQNLLHIMWFKNQGIFNVLGQNFLSPPSWTFTVMLFLYFLPRKGISLYLYVLTFAAYSVGYGLIVHNAGLFDFRPWLYHVVSYFVFLGWWTFITGVFLKTSRLTKSSEWSPGDYER